MVSPPPLPSLLVVIALSYLLKLDAVTTDNWHWTRWMREGQGRMGHLGPGEDPLESSVFLLLPFLLSSHSFDLTRGSREPSVGKRGLLTVTHSSEWVEM